MTKYRIIAFVQSGKELAECSRLFQGDAPDYMVGGYSQPVIDYLKQWDIPEWIDDDIRDEKPRCSSRDTEYPDENGVYTLRYDNSLGGVFMLYRKCNKNEL